ncbi:hypothetical protein ACIKT0_13375 [Hansschlegelia beijingensis]|uniref:hypothetical protein n=1 Tax=Hansschlegelia beijingensis TaxID=1133344 RepID=UPI00387F08AB
MTRCAGAAALLTAALAAPQASAQELACAPPEVVTARYSEQICNRGATGFVVCRWIDRRHDVIAPGECVPRVTVEAAAPSGRSIILPAAPGHGAAAGYVRKD